jgi:hypothetical protein
MLCMRVTSLVKAVLSKLVVPQKPPAVATQLQLVLLQLALVKFAVGTADPCATPPLIEKL